MQLSHPLASLGLLVAVSPICSAYCQAALARPLVRGTLSRRAAGLRALPLLYAHAVFPMCFDATSAAVTSALLAGAIYTWWGTMKVSALCLASDGPLAAFAHAPSLHFWCAYFLPMSLRPTASDVRSTAGGSAQLASAFVTKLCLVLLLLGLLDTRLPLLSAGAPLGDAAWCIVLLLAASGLMEFAAALAETVGLPTLPAFDAPLLA
eukprot:5048083-Prymnesium_polylepis.2